MNLKDLFHFNQYITQQFNSFLIPDNSSLPNYEVYNSFVGATSIQIEDFHENIMPDFVEKYKLSGHEYFVLLAVLLPHIYRNSYRGIRFLQKLDEDYFSSLGGAVCKSDGICYPTIDTLVFLLVGNNIMNRFAAEELVSVNSSIMNNGLLVLDYGEPASTELSTKVLPSAELLAIVKGQEYTPNYSSSFPAQRLSTDMSWSDLVLPYETLEALEELRIWMKHKDFLMQHPELKKRIKPGYRTLFYGPPGTGKTLTASLIGRLFETPVYRIDLSMVVSKWVGETEKNLKRLFDTALNKNWILFFDEADSIFGKRTQTKSSNDRYANQEVSYLLQRIEDYPGLIVLASNLKSNMDEAFNRRFQSAILFPMPDHNMRFELWTKAFPKDFSLDEEIDMRVVAKKYELAGGAISNIVRFCALKALDRGDKIILFDDLEYAIIREFRKSGKIVN